MKLFLYISLLLAYLTVPFSINADDQNVSTQKLAGEFLRLTQNNQFEQAALLFHYPGTYSAEKKESEFRSVRDGLKKHKDKFGNITEIVNNIPDEQFLGSGVSGAEFDYWKQQTGDSPSIMIPCRFEKLNFGIIRLIFCKIRDKYEIQSVDYSFIKNSEPKK